MQPCQPSANSPQPSRHEFIIPPGDFTDAERALLARHGSWLEALASGVVQPTTPAQEHFIQVAQGRREPSSDFELAWAKVLLQRNSVPEIVRKFHSLAQARARANQVNSEYMAARAEVLALVRDQLSRVDEEFAERIRNSTDASADCELQVRELVLRLGRGVRLAGVRAAYCAGRVSWDNEQLEQYALQHPEITEFRRTGNPWVNLRFLEPIESPATASGS